MTVPTCVKTPERSLPLAEQPPLTLTIGKEQPRGELRNGERPLRLFASIPLVRGARRMRPPASSRFELQRPRETARKEIFIEAHRLAQVR